MRMHCEDDPCKRPEDGTNKEVGRRYCLLSLLITQTARTGYHIQMGSLIIYDITLSKLNLQKGA